MSHIIDLGVVKDENGNIVDSYDIRNMGLKKLLFMIFAELREMNLHLKSMTDEEIDIFDKLGD